jgi:hypothetical protein
MNIGLKVAYLWHDIDASKLRVTAENAEFRGTADVYVGTDALLEATTTLAGFPKNHPDKRGVAFGAAGKKFAGGAVRLEFYSKDMAGHAAFRATIEGDYGDREVAENATVCVDFDPAALDEFLLEFKKIETEHRGSASMVASVVVVPVKSCFSVSYPAHPDRSAGQVVARPAFWHLKLFFPVAAVAEPLRSWL